MPLSPAACPPAPTRLPAALPLADARYLHFVAEVNQQLNFAQFELRRVKYLVSCWVGAGCMLVLA